MRLIEPVNKRKYLIVFVHGFIGSKETWERTDCYKSILTYFSEDEQIRKHFDISLFDYDTSLSNLILKLKYLMGFLLGRKVRFTRNLPIKKLSELFVSELEYKARNYESVVIIAHSMGGLVAKALVLEEIKRFNKGGAAPKIGLYITLCTPHAGANLALVGKLFFTNAQIKDLAPTNDFLLELNNDWVQSKQLPDRLYIFGLNDQIVPRGAWGIDSEINFPIKSKDDHFSILVPEQDTDQVLNGIKHKCLEFVAQKEEFTDKPEYIKPTGLIEGCIREKPTRPYFLIISIALSIIFFTWQILKPSPQTPIPCETCQLIDSTGLSVNYLQRKNEDTNNFSLADFGKQEVELKIGKITFEEFIDKYSGPFIEVDTSTFRSWMRIDTAVIEEIQKRVITFNLPKEKTKWRDFVIAVSQKYFRKNIALNFDNAENWLALPETTTGRVQFAFRNLQHDKQPSFIIPIK